MVEREYESYPLDRRDGVKVMIPDGWFLVRGSNTEPIIRLVAESDDEAEAHRLVEELRAIVVECVG